MRAVVSVALPCSYDVFFLFSSSNVDFPSLVFAATEPPSGSRSPDDKGRSKSETPPPVLDCYANLTPPDEESQLVMDDYIRNNPYEEPMVLTSEVGPSEAPILTKATADIPQCLEDAFSASQCSVGSARATKTPEAPAKSAIAKGKRREKKTVQFSKESEERLRRSTRQVIRKNTPVEPPEGIPTKAKKGKGDPAKGQIYERSSSKSNILVGEEYQADVPNWVELISASAGSEEIKYDIREREECLWKECDEPLDGEELEELYQVTRRQYEMLPSHMLHALYRNNFDFNSAMEHIEEYMPNYKKPFSQEEEKLFFKGLAMYGKDFRTIKKELVVTRTVRELVEFYYDTKNAVCFGNIKKGCPCLLRLDAPEMPAVKRFQCDNCTGKLEELETKDAFQLCEVCDLYYRRTGIFRPFSVPLTNGSEGEHLKEEARKVSDVSDPCCSSSQAGDHACSFTTSKLKILQVEKPWTPQEMVDAVKAFYRCGKDFQAVSAALGTKSAATVKRFYVEKQSAYRLDFIIGRRNTKKEEKTASKNSSKTKKTAASAKNHKKKNNKNTGTASPARTTRAESARKALGAGSPKKALATESSTSSSQEPEL